MESSTFARRGSVHLPSRARSRVGGTRDRGLQAAVLGAAQRHREAVAVDHAARDVEAEAEAMGLALARLVAALAPLHQALQLLLGDARAVVEDTQAEAVRALFEED